MDIKLRRLGNVLTVVGYFILLHVDPLLGSSVKLLGFLLVVPYLIRVRIYDFIALIVFFGVMDLSNVIKLLIN